MKLFIPGPTEVLPQNLAAQTKAMIGHRSEEYAQLHESIENNLRTLLDTKNDIFVCTNSATGCMEAAIRNCVRKEVLCLVNGAFSERWAVVAEQNGKKVTRLKAPWGSAVTPARLETFLRHKQYDAVTVVLSETSTGARAPIEGLAKIMQKHPETLFMVDGVSIVGGEPVNVDHLGIDVLLFGTQKALALPPGVAFMAVSPSALARAKKVRCRGFYFDFLNLKKYADRHQTPVTPPISLLYATAEQLNRIVDKEGVQNRFMRHQVMANRVRDWGRQYFETFTDPRFLVNTITNFKAPGWFDTATFIQQAKKRGLVISNGYGPLKNKCFRIGHLGDHTIRDIEKLLHKLDQLVLNQLTHETTHRQQIRTKRTPATQGAKTG
jgi:aspartate aminotransferase-like enzyme